MRRRAAEALGVLDKARRHYRSRVREEAKVAINKIRRAHRGATRLNFLTDNTQDTIEALKALRASDPDTQVWDGDNPRPGSLSLAEVIKRIEKVDAAGDGQYRLMA